MINLTKGGKKWIYGVCYSFMLLAFSVVGSFLIFTKNTSALRHEIQTLPLASESSQPMVRYPAGALGSGNPKFQVIWNSQNAPSSSDFHINTPVYYFTSRVSNNKCTFVAYTDHYYSTPNYSGDSFSFTFGFDSYRTRTSSSYEGTYAVCSQTLPFGSTYSDPFAYSTHPDFDSSSLNNIPPLDRVHYNVLPYYFGYNGVYRYDSRNIEGADYTHALHFSELTGFNISKPHTIVIPLGQSQSSISGQITQGRNFTYTGQLSFDSSFHWRPNIGNNLKFNLNWIGKDSSDISNNDNHAGSVPCSVTTTSLSSLNQITVKFSCSFDSPITVVDDIFYAWLYIHDDETEWLFETSGDMIFSVAYLTTDFDDSPGDPVGIEIVGNDADHAPGSVLNTISSSGSFIDQFNNLFHFSVINPLQPIFESFTNNNSCVQIPIIASMLGSSETQYCPIFNSTLRGIVTPVFSLIAIFMVFFFFVKWLNSSSGNDFMDSGGKK